jgi:hypothetical protein
MIPAIGSIATQQAQATTATMKVITQLLNYCATHPKAVVRYFALKVMPPISARPKHAPALPAIII